jgi:ATP-binding protein involved in chromosome partitioning
VPTTKDIIRDSLAGVQPHGLNQPLGDGLKWVAECDGFVNLKLCTPGLGAPEARRAAASEARDALALALAEAGTALRSLIVEFVDEAGGVLQTERLGAGQPAPRATQPAPRETDPAPAGEDAADACSAPVGHRPIGGLSDTTGQARPPASPLDSIRHIVAVGAGKGGVGKSTVAVALAVGLARRGHAVGLLDGDIYGPSMPTMLGLDEMEQMVVAGKLQPHAVHGVKAITIGKLVDPDKPLIWRGPMAHGAFKQLIEQTDWGELDYLIVDLPPGTGDVCLTLAQTLPCTGAVIVCTPQKVAQDDAVRAARMFQQLNIEVLGVVENMSYFLGDPDDQGRVKEYDIFGRGGAEVMAQRLGVPFLGAIPINMAMRANADEGEPVKNFEPATAGGGALPTALESMITTLEGQVALAQMRQGKGRPSLSIS